MSFNDQSEYPFTGRPDEIARLNHQALLLNPLSEQFLSRVSLQAGMHVVDFGCGTGEFTFLAAAQVGRSGFVVGIDRSACAVADAEAKARVLGYRNVLFRTADLEEMTFDMEADVVTGRFILSYLKNPEALLTKAREELQGLQKMVFQEWQLDAAPPTFPLSVHTLRFHELVLAVLRKMGVDMNMGIKLPAMLQRVSGGRTVLIDGRQYIGSAADDQLVAYLAQTWNSLSDRMVEHGLLSSRVETERVLFETLAEISKLGVTVSLNPMVGVAVEYGSGLRSQRERAREHE